MTKFINAFAHVKSRLLAVSPFIAAGAVASVVTAPDFATGAVITVLQTLGSLAGNVAATDVHAALSDRVLRDDVLKNHDLTRVIRDTIGSIIHRFATDISDDNQKEALEKLARIDEDIWAETETLVLQPQMIERLSANELVELFSKSPENFAKIKSLDLDSWRDIVTGLAAANSFVLEGDIFSSSSNLMLPKSIVDALASQLYETFPRALYEILKEDFKQDGKAYSGLLIKLVGNISEVQVDTREKAYEILGKTTEILKTVQRIEHKVDVLHDRFDSFQDGVVYSTPSRLAINLPPHNLLFTGRKDVLDALVSKLKKNKRVALAGMPGVGKTQTAIEYAHAQYGAKIYDYVIYARAASEMELLTDFVSVAQALNLPNKYEANFNLVAAGVKTWLEGAEKWLLIFDNADDLAVVRSHIPVNRKGHVIFTRRPVDASGFAYTLKVETMGVGEGTLLLLRRAGLAENADTLDTIASDTVEQARAITLEMDGLPLSLDIAGAFIKETSTSLIEYLELYRTEGKLLRKERDRDADYAHSVATAFTLALKKMATPDDSQEASVVIAHAAADLLHLCAFLAPDAIPLELLLATTDILGENLKRALDNKIWRKKAFARAPHYSLLDVNTQAQTYDMHREVQAVMRDEMDDYVQRCWAEQAVRLLRASFPDVTQFTEWEACDLFLPHARVCLKYSDRLKIDIQDVALLKNLTALHLKNRVRYGEAAPLFEEALELNKKLFGLEGVEVTISMNNLASCYELLGRYAEAELLHEQALEMRKRLFGSDHLDVAISMNNLAAFYREKGRYMEAEPLFEQAFEIIKKTFGLEHPDVIKIMGNLAELYYLQGRYGEAEPLYEKTLEIRKKLFGLEHPDVAESMNSLADLYESQGRYAEAEPLYEKTLEVRKKLFGLEHPEVALSMNNLGALYNSQGRYSESESLCKQALEIREKVFGPEHPYVAMSINNLAVSYELRGRYTEAQVLHERALEIRKKAFGLEHPDVTMSLNNLASSYSSQGYYAKAEPLFEQALKLNKKLFGLEHPEVAGSMNNLAGIYEHQGRDAEAELLYKQALEMKKKLFGLEHQEVAVTMNNLASLYSAQGNYTEAGSLYKQAVMILERTLGLGHPYTITARRNFNGFQREKAARIVGG